MQRYRRWCAIAVANKNPPATSFHFHSLAVSRDNVKRYTTFDIGKLSVIHYYAPALRIGGIKRWSASDACLSDVCLSRTSGLSREQGGLGRLNWHTGSPRHRWLGHHFQRQKVKGQLCRGRGHIVAASRKISWKSGWPRKVKRPAGRSVKKQLVRVEQLISQWVAVESVIQ